MARMIPAAISADTISVGERQLFELLRDDPVTAGWTILHSLDIAEHTRQVSGEADFLVIIPDRGVVCLEVKACNALRRDQGMWYYGSDSRPDSRGPFRQAANAMHSLRKRLLAATGGLDGVVFWSAVAFPYIDFATTSAEWHAWQVIDKQSLASASIGARLVGVIENARRHLATCQTARWFDKTSKAPTAEQCSIIAQTLRPDFEFFESPKARTAKRREELKRYTEEQYGALDAMDTNVRVIFEGPAGTGKTLLAIEAARRAAQAGRRVLLVCFNRILGRWLEDQAKSLPSAVSCGTIHRYMLSLARVDPGEKGDKSVFWQKELPELAMAAILESPARYEIDELIIDEAQDLVRDEYLELFDLVLKGGLSKGRWKMFGDFEKQSIYASDIDLSVAKARLAEQSAAYSLRINCRNTPRIGELARMLGGLNPNYKKILRPDNGVEPDIQYYADAASQQVMLNQILEELLARRYSPRDIVVLSPRVDGAASAAPVSRKYRLRTFAQATEGDVRFGSIHAYKGMESVAVVVTDIEHIQGPEAQALFYIAVTRPLEALIILADQKAKREVLAALLPSTQKEPA